MALTKIAIIGANGNLGPFILKALLSNPQFQTTVLTRESSKSTYPTNVPVTKLPDSLPHDSLVSALQGQDALVIAVAGTQTSSSLKLIDAASEAGISRIIPADFGSCDSADPRSLSLIPLYPEKKKVRDHLTQLVSQSSGSLSWTSIVCAHFLDFGLRSDPGLMGIDIKPRKAIIFDGGEKFFSASLLRTVGAAVVGVLTHPEETRDRMVYVHTVRTTQNELLGVVEKVVAKGKFEVEYRDSDEFIREKQDVLKTKPGDHHTTEQLVMVEGLVNADWAGRENFKNELFGLPDEDLEEVVREALEGLF